MIRGLHRHRPGATLMEMLVAITIGSGVALGAASIAIREVDARGTNQDELQNQQALAYTLQTFTQDVRSGNAIVRQEPAYFRLRKVMGAEDYQYVSYRLEAGKLQRGTSTSRTSEPTGWADVFDSQRFSVAAGSFAYFTLSNGKTGTMAQMRRIEIAGFRLQTASRGLAVKTPPISAVMREASRTRDLNAECAVEINGHCKGANAWQSGSVHVTLCARNRSGLPITVKAFQADWSSAGGAGNPIEAIKLDNGGVIWGQGSLDYDSGEAPQAFKTSVTIPASDTEKFVLHFHKVSSKVRSLVLKLYGTDDPAFENPYLITAEIPD